MTRFVARRPVRSAVTGIAVSASVALLTGLTMTPASAGTAAAAQRPAPGAASIGDRLYPGLGNGGYDALNYDLRLRYATSKPSQAIDGTEVLTARSTQALSRFNLDFAGGGITAVTVDGKAARFVHDHQELVITPQTPIAMGAVFTTTIRHFSATPTEPGELTPTDALVVSPDGSATAGQPDAEHYVFPSNDHPRDKASFTVSFDVPAGITAVANGVRTSQRTSGGRSYTTYRQQEPMATELIQLAVGRYTVINRKPVNGVAVRDVVPTRLLSDYQDKLGIERSQIAWMEKRVGPYPFPVYGTMVTTAPLGFALETQTLSIFDQTWWDDPIGVWGPTMTHELAHQWFGDNVAPYEWSDIWLNEGHATWYETTYAAEKGWLDDDYGFADFTDLMKSIYAAGDQYRADYGPVALLTDGSLDEQFSPNVYDGGALVLYALRQKIGDAAFGRVERAWVTTYSGKAASTDDFIALASRVAGKNLVNFLGAWVYGTTTPPMPGHPDWTVDPVSSSASKAAATAQATGAPRLTWRVSTRR